MQNPVYKWEWRRGHGKHFIVLLKDDKKIASARELWQVQQCTCFPFNCYDVPDELRGPRFAAYVGGQKLGLFKTMPDAKAEIETKMDLVGKTTTSKSVATYLIVSVMV